MARTKISAGLMMYRIRGGEVQVLLVHPGGPYFRNKDEGSWTIPKGETLPDEELLDTARREFLEETGMTPDAEYVPLTPVKQKGGKTVYAWGFEGDCDPDTFFSNTFTIEWPPRSGKQQEFPEVDRAEFFDIETARAKINAAQTPFLDELALLVMAR